MKPATIKDVALAAGVSVGSVSNVINGSRSVKAGTVKRVKAAMEKLGYRPSAAAQSMRTRSTRAVGFVVNDISNPIYASIAKEAERLLNEQGYHLILVDSDNRPGQEVEIFNTLNSGRVDALVATLSDEQDPNIIRALKNVDVPVVLLDREVDFPLDSICIDYAKGLEKAVNYLTDLGHEDIALICGGENIRPGRECIKGYRAALKKKEISFQQARVKAGPLTADFGYQQAMELLSRPERPTALICGGNRIFAGALRAIKFLGLKMPDNLSVIAFDDTELTALSSPEITVIARDTKEIGAAVGQFIIRALEGEKDAGFQNVILSAELLVRESCANVKRK